MKFQFLEHTADIKFRAFGKDVNEKFTNSALAVKETIVGDLQIKSNLKRKIRIRGEDMKSLLYGFLEEFLYLLDAEDFLLNEVETLVIDEKKFELEAFVSGDRASKYEFVNSVKAVTYNQMEITSEYVQVVLDV